jgi:NADH-quinone oxidoreductase subunit M
VFYGLASAGLLIAIGLIYERTQTSFIPRLGGLFDTNSALGVLFFIAAFSTLIIPGTPSYETAYLLISGIIDEYGWTIALLLLLGNLFTAAVLLRAFQQLFIATPRRFTVSSKQLKHYASHTTKKPLIGTIICVLLLASGYYNKPWLNLLNHDISALLRSFPIHSSGQLPLLPAVK